MKKDSKQVIRLVLTGMFLLSFLVSCVTLEKMGLSKGTKEGEPAASQSAPGTQAQEQASYPRKGSETGQPAKGEQTAAKPMSGKQEAAQYFIHQVKWDNESLSIIAKWYTGSLMNWKALAKANPEMEPTVIHKGDRIRIPVSMLKTRDPMPADFVEELIQNLRKESPSHGTQEEKQEEEEPALFGPKGVQEE
jgi:hypothetical protein